MFLVWKRYFWSPLDRNIQRGWPLFFFSGAINVSTGCPRVSFPPSAHVER